MGRWTGRACVSTSQVHLLCTCCDVLCCAVLCFAVLCCQPAHPWAYVTWLVSAASHSLAVHGVAGCMTVTQHMHTDVLLP